MLNMVVAMVVVVVAVVVNAACAERSEHGVLERNGIAVAGCCPHHR